MQRSLFRRLTALVLVVVAAVSALVAALGVWTNENVFDSERFAATGVEILAQPEVTDAVGRHLTDQVFGVAARMTDRDLNGRVARVVRANAQSRISALLAGESIQQVTGPALLRTHQELVAAINGRQRAVTINLLPLATVVLNDLKDASILPSWVGVPQFRADGDPARQILELSTALRVDIPPDFGQVTIMGEHASATATRARDALRLFHDIVAGALAASVVFTLGAVLVSPRRPRTIVHLGVAAALAWVAGVLAIDAVRAFVTGLVDSADRNAVALSLRLFLATWTDLSARLILMGVAVAALGIMLDIRAGMTWIPVLLGLAIAASTGLGAVSLFVGLLVAVVGALAVRATVGGRSHGSGDPGADGENIRSVN